MCNINNKSPWRRGGKGTEMIKELTGGAKVGTTFNRAMEVYKKNFVPICVAALLAGLVGAVSCGICTAPLLCGVFAMILKAMRDSNAQLNIGDVFQGFSKFFVPAFVGCLVLSLINQAATAILVCIPIIGWIALVVVAIAMSAAMLWSLFLVTDQGATVGDAITVPLKLLKDKRFWSVVLVTFVACLIGSVGAIACGVGVLVTMPFAYCMIAAAYEEAYAGGTTSAEEQQPPAAEIPAP